MRACRAMVLVVVAAALMLAGCGHPSAPASGHAQRPAGAAHAPARAARTASAGAPPGVHRQTRRYRIDITYPHLPASDAVLAQALRRAGADARQQFVHALPDPKQYPALADRHFQLKLDFSVVARMPAFVSVRERGMADTGGAHPVPVDATFVYAVRAGKLVTFDDLFTDPAQARKRFARLARTALEAKLLAKVPGGPRTPVKARREWIASMRGMIEQGTQPTAQDFSRFLVLAGVGDKASGLLLVFPPYQVAPYVYGSQTVQVPVEVFADLLQPAFRGDFDGGA